MKIKVFTTNENGKIELTKEELQELIDEASQYSLDFIPSRDETMPIFQTEPYCDNRRMTISSSKESWSTATNGLSTVLNKEELK